MLHIALPFLMLVAVGQTTFYHQLEALHLLASPLKMGLKPNTPSDSDNTTTRPFVTRRRVLEGTAIAIVGAKGNEFVSNALETNQSVDPAVAVWQKWQAAHDRTEWLCRKQQRLERKLVETVGFPSANVRLRDGESVTTHSLEALHELTGDAAVRAKAEAELAAHQARWDAADREIGYSTTLLAECEAGDRVEQLLEMLSETPAASLAGVAALGKAKSPKTVLSFPGHRSARSSRILVGLVNRHRRVEWSQTGRVDRSIIDSGCFHFATKQLTQREEPSRRIGYRPSLSGGGSIVRQLIKRQAFVPHSAGV
ncbi:hypothetical protein FJ958_21895 [Mesorhizobium sp. B2-3-5]|nr:hypothetical protein FJ958_21895 [Mesorhizobium sp. B2-3-5]